MKRHGVDIDRLMNKERGILFSIWDFAGHEEYHVAHSFFFASGCVYLLLFDLSKDVHRVVSENKLLYWLHFLETQIGRDTKVVLLGTKLDLLEQKFGFFERESKTKQRLEQINEEIKRVITQNRISLSIHKFESKNDEEEEKLFFPIKNREFQLEKAGIASIYEILSRKYDNIEHTVSTTLKHKIVFEKIKYLSEVSQGMPFTPTEKHTSNNFLSPVKEGVTYQPFLDFFNLKDSLSQMAKEQSNEEALEAVEELENILVDLHKLGVIVYFNHDTLKNTIISDPRWFNRVFKAILDYGRKQIQMMIEEVWHTLKQADEEGKVNLAKNAKDTAFKLCEDTLNWLKGKQFGQMDILQIWKQREKRDVSIVDKVSFHHLLELLEKIEGRLREEKMEWVIKEASEMNQIDLSQSILSINEEKLRKLLVKILGEHSRFDGQSSAVMIDLLIKFDLVIPKGRQKFDNSSKFSTRKQNYLVPLLFPVKSLSSKKKFFF